MVHRKKIPIANVQNRKWWKMLKRLQLNNARLSGKTNIYLLEYAHNAACVQ